MYECKKGRVGRNRRNRNPDFKRQPQRFCTESDWQASVSQYGVCGKYVYEAGVSVRLPKVTGFVEGTLDVNALGDLVEAGLPNITGKLATSVNRAILWDAGASIIADGSFAASGSGANSNAGTNGSGSNTISFDASRSSSIYGNSNTVQPQSIKGYMYIVVATTTKTEIEIDIDNVVTDLNQKVDISNMVDISEAGQDITNLVMPDYSAGISIANDTLFTAPSDGWIVCRQNADNGSGQVIIAGQTFVTINESGNSSIAQCSTFLISKGETFRATLVQTCVFFPLKGVN